MEDELLLVVALRAKDGTDEHRRHAVVGNTALSLLQCLRLSSDERSHLTRILDLLLTGEENEDVTGRLLLVDVPDGLQRRLHVVGLWLREVEGGDRERASLDVENRAVV